MMPKQFSSSQLPIRSEQGLQERDSMKFSPRTSGYLLWRGIIGSSRFFSTLKSKKIVVCKPAGGINDSLCMIEGAWVFAESNGLPLVIDASKSSVPGPLDAVFNFKTIRPLILTTREDAADFALALRSHPLVQVVQAGGAKGGIESLSFLKRVSLTKQTRSAYQRELEGIGPRYAAIHIRHSDYKTEFKSVLRKIHRLEKKRIFLATDSYEVEKFAQHLFGEKLFTVPRNRPRDSTPLHKQAVRRDSDEARQTVIDAIVDLLLLASAQKFYYTATFGVGQGYSRVVSGFGLLAKELRQAPEILDTLTGELQPDRPKKSLLVITPRQVTSLVWRQRHRPVFHGLYKRLSGK
jgi:hypothetical protein